MADNTTLNSGSGGDTIATDDIAGIKHQRVKIQYGADGSATDVSDSNPLPIDDAGGSITVDGTVTADAGTGPWPVTDNGGSLTVDGTVTANLSATDNAVLDAIDSNTDYGAVTGGGTETGALRVTVANNSTGVLSVDDNGGSLTVDGTVTANLSATDNAVLDNIDTNTTDVPNVIGTDGATGPTRAISIGGTQSDGTFQEVAVDASGNLQVDIVSGSSSGTEYDEDAATPATISGTAVMMERDDALATLTPAEGDWAALRCDSTGALWVNAVNAGGTATDDAAFTVTTDTVAVLGGVVTSDSVDSGDAGAVAMSTDRRLHVDAQIVGQDADVTIADGGNSITVDGTVTANLSATDNTVLDNIDANTTRGSSHYRNVDANAEAAIKASAGTLHWLHVMNMTAAVAYLHLYDATAASVTPGTTTPTFTFPIPTQGDTNGAGFNLRLEHDFSTAITMVCTTTIDGSTGDPGTNGVFVNAGYT